MNKCAEYGVPVEEAIRMMSKIAKAPDYSKLSEKELSRLWGNNGYIDAAIARGELPRFARVVPPSIGKLPNSEPSIAIFYALQDAAAKKWETIEKIKRATNSRIAGGGTHGYWTDLGDRSRWTRYRSPKQHWAMRMAKKFKKLRI